MRSWNNQTAGNGTNRSGSRSVRDSLSFFGKRFCPVDSLTFGRSLVILLVVALATSTAATVIVEILLFLTVLGFRPLRRELFKALRQPMVVMALVLFGLITVGIFYSVEPLSESADAWSGWRKLLLVPMVAALFQDRTWKERLAFLFVVLLALFALLSTISYLLGLGKGIYDGVIFHNHATQGMLFSVALFASLVMFRFPPVSFFVGRWLFLISGVILLSNIIMVTPGRSGYLALLVLVMVFILWGVPRKAQLIFLLLAPVVILSLLMVSPVAQKGILQGIEEMKSYEQDKKPTSMGLRVVIWKHTITLLKQYERPVFGYGTGGFERAYASVLDEKRAAEKPRWQDMPIHDPHNQYLIILVEYGVAGLVLFLLFIGAFFIQPAGQPFYVLGVGVLLAWCATSLFNGHFNTAIEGRFLLVWCAAMLSADMAAQTGEVESEAGP